MKTNKHRKNIRYHVKYHYSTLIIAVVLVSLMLPFINALTGNYSTTSPFSCGSNCNGGYELSGHNATYCYNNPIDCYNTIDGCRDGSNYGFEFVNNIYVESLNGSNFTGGYRINVTVEVDCDGDGDTMTISYHNGSAFRAIQDDTCAVSALVNKTYSFVLDDVAGNHTVRAVIVYNGGTQMECGYNYDTTFSDTDDVTFYVNQGPDNANPKVTDISPNSGTAFNQTYGLKVVVSANVTDNYNITSVQALVEWNSYNQTLDLSLVSGNNYSANFTNITELTRYNVTITANDTSGNSNNTETTYFTINSTTNITITSPTNRQLLPYGDVNLRFTIESGYATDTAMYSIDGGANTTVTDKLSLGFNQSDQNGAIGEADIAYANLSISFIPSENMSIENVSIKIKRNGSGTSSSQVQIRTDSGGSPSNTILGLGNITNTSVSTNYSFVNITLNNTVNLTENTTYWLFLAPNGSATDFYTWEASNDGLYSDGNYSNNNSLDLLFILYDKYKYNTTITSISKGRHEIIVNANSSSMNPINSQLIMFIIDNTAPNIRTTSYAPNTTAGIDPDITINVSANISDQLEISQVLLQYKQINESSFTNASMQNISGLYKANFTPDTANNWTFRVYAIDSSNNTAFSSNITVNVSFEFSWNRSPSVFNTTSALLDTNTSIGNITINNSGDINLTFNISKISNTVPSVYFNNTEGSLLVNVTAGSSVEIEVNATGQSIESKQNMVIRIDPLNASIIPDYQLTNLTFISYVSGPYLNVRITDYDATVTQDQERVGLTATIINVGNETANNVTANWTLPNGWSAKTNSTAFYTTISVGQQVSFTRFYDIASNAATGTQTIQVDVNCSEGKDDSDQRSVNVSGTGGVGQTPPPSGGGGGGGYLPTQIIGLEIDIVEEIELERGTEYTFRGFLKNAGNADLKNITMVLEGYPTLHYKITPDSIDELLANTSKPFLLLIKVPQYFGSGKHETELQMEGMVGGNLKKFHKDILIIVFTEDKSNAEECFKQAESKIAELEDNGIITKKMRESLLESKGEYNSKNYAQSNNLCNYILEQGELALKLKQRLDSINKAYSKLDKEVPELQEIILLAQAAFENEDYVLANRRVEQAELLLGIKEKEIQQALSYKWGQLREYLVQIISGVIVLIIIVVFIHSSTSISGIKRRINALEGRREGVNEKIKETQRKYFVQKTLPSRMYKKHMEHHRDSLSDIEKKKHELHLKKLKAVSGRTLKDLDKTKQEAIDKRKELHRKYYVDKTIDKKSFNKLDSSLEKIIQDIDKRIGMKKK